MLKVQVAEDTQAKVPLPHVITKLEFGSVVQSKVIPRLLVGVFGVLKLTVGAISSCITVTLALRVFATWSTEVTTKLLVVFRLRVTPISNIQKPSIAVGDTEAAHVRVTVELGLVEPVTFKTLHEVYSGLGVLMIREFGILSSVIVIQVELTLLARSVAVIVILFIVCWFRFWTNETLSEKFPRASAVVEAVAPELSATTFANGSVTH